MTALHVPAGEGPLHQMIDGDRVVKAVVHDAAGAFEVVGDVAVDQPMDQSMGAILSVTQRHGVSLAGG